MLMNRIITISREFGSGGRTIGKQAAAAPLRLRIGNSHHSGAPALGGTAIRSSIFSIVLRLRYTSISSNCA